MIKRTLIGVWLVVILVAAVASPAVQAQEDGTNPAGYPLRQSLYLPMRDGVRIAVDVWLPATLQPGQIVPTLLRMTRYWRAAEGIPQEDLFEQWFIESGYALVVVDARGSGASEGARPIEWSPDEIADYGEVIDWVIAQPWSNGRVGAYGISYEGNTAELVTINQHPALKAVAPMFNDFDPLYVAAMPGGVLAPGFIQTWGDGVAALDRNDICPLAGATTEAECAMIRRMVPGVRPVDEDADKSQLESIIANRQNPNVFEVISGITYRDDPFGSSGYGFADISPFALREPIERSGVPMFVWLGWLDAATVSQGLGRFMTFSNPQKVIIGPWDHGANNNADPFQPAETPVEPDLRTQFETLRDWFDPYLRGEGTEHEHSIYYYTMNAGTWTTTDTWPPAGFSPVTWYFGDGGSLVAELPTAPDAADLYPVNFAAKSGESHSNRWATQVYGEDVYYPDRAAEDALRLTYTSAPLSSAVEITGTPVVTVYLASTHEDGALHVYLEAVAPDGRVVYLTEGVLRLIHRVSTSEPPYAMFGPYRSMTRADAAPLVPGEIIEVPLGLEPTSIVVPAGWSLRVALAGADAEMFARYPTEGDPVLTIARSSTYPSRIELPMAETDKTPLVQ